MPTIDTPSVCPCFAESGVTLANASDSDAATTKAADNDADSDPPPASGVETVTVRAPGVAARAIATSTVNDSGDTLRRFETVRPAPKLTFDVTAKFVEPLPVTTTFVTVV